METMFSLSLCGGGNQNRIPRCVFIYFFLSSFRPFADLALRA